MLSKNQKQKTHNPFSKKYRLNYSFVLIFMIVFLSLLGLALFLFLMIK